MSRILIFRAVKPKRLERFCSFEFTRSRADHLERRLRRWAERVNSRSDHNPVFTAKDSLITTAA